MDPAKMYNLVFYGHRDNYGWDSAALVTISGADAFVNESSTGTVPTHEHISGCR
jgi:hypothetical protein